MLPRHSITVTLLLGLTALFAGCGDDPPSPDDVAKYSSQALGIPVLLWAKSDDGCVARQLGALYREFRKDSPESQARLVEKFKAYSAIIVGVSADEGAVKADSYELRLKGTNRVARVSAPMVTASGQPLATRIARDAQPSGGPALYITPVSARDSSVTKVIEVGDAKLFNDLAGIKHDPAGIESALLSKSVKLVETRPAAAVNCGRLATFSDLAP